MQTPRRSGGLLPRSFVRRSLVIMLAVAAAPSVSGCRKTTVEPPQSGPFTGILRSQTVLTVTADSEAKTPNKPQDGWVFNLSLPGETGPVPLNLELKDANHLGVEWAGWLSTPLLLNVSAGSPGCFEAPKDAPYTAQFCLSKTSLELDYRSATSAFSLSLVQVAAGTIPPLEDARTLKLDELVHHAKSQSFDSRIQAERALQSRLKAKQAYLSLLPSLNLWTGMKLATATDFTSIVSLAGSLTPFLFPSRWIQAVESQHLARADAHAGVALRADVGFIAETLALSYLRDRDSLLKLQEELTLVRPLRDELLARERLGLVEPGTSEELALLVGDLEMTAEALGTELVAERATLAETLGFMNPEAILEIEDPGNPAVLLPNEEELRRSREIALVRSFELKQMDELIRAAQLDKLAKFFMWLDPSGESAANLGAGLPFTVQVSQAKISELHVTREKLQATILQKITESHHRLDAEHRYQAMLRENSVLQADRLDRLMGKMRMGMLVPVSDLLRAIQGRIRTDLDLVRSRYQLRAASVLWDRSIYSGNYNGE